MNHAMIDVEALRLSQPWKAPLLEVGCTAFDEFGGALASISFAIEPSLLPSWAEEDPETRRWWESPEQAEAWSNLQNRIRFDGVMPQVALTGLVEFMQKHAVGAYWFAGPTYDQVMLEAYYDHYGMPRPWAYNATRDFRTIRKQYPDIWERMIATRVGHHNAAADCEFQVSVLHEIHWEDGSCWK